LLFFSSLKDWRALMDLRLEILKSFLKVAELGSFSGAAIQLKKSQGGISQQIASLEEYFGAELFKRTMKGVKLTEEGKVLVKRAKELFELLDLAQKEINELKDENRGKILIAASTIPGEHLLPVIISAFKSQNPQINFELESSDSELSLRKLEEKQVDFAAVGINMMTLQKFDSVELAREQLVVIMSPEHPLAEKKQIHIQDLLQYPFVTRDSTSGTRIETEKLLEKAGLVPSQLQIHLTLATTESVITAVSEGLGISMISSIAAFKAAAANRIKATPLKIPSPPVRSLYLVRLKQKSQDRLLDLFWEFVKQFMMKKMQ